MPKIMDRIFNKFASTNMIQHLYLCPIQCKFNANETTQEECSNCTYHDSGNEYITQLMSDPPSQSPKISPTKYDQQLFFFLQFVNVQKFNVVYSSFMQFVCSKPFTLHSKLAVDIYIYF